MKKITSIVIGFGQIGSSLFNVLKKTYNTNVSHRDIKSEEKEIPVDIMHICFPYGKKFIKEVKKYQKIYSPKYTVIHSTVPRGTSSKCNSYYSPVRGIHPHLENSLKTFVKYLAPKNEELAEYFTACGIKIEQHDSTDSLEVMKLYCTTLYGLNIIAEKEIWNYCQKHGLDFDVVYTKSNKTYNDGYKELGFPQFVKYTLTHQDGKIGGHCVIPNCDLLKTPVAKFIKNQNKKIN